MGSKPAMNRGFPVTLPAKDLEHVLSHAQLDFLNLRGARLFVTGGTGFFGKWLLSSFIHANRTLDLHAAMVLLTRDAGRFRTECPGLAADPAITFSEGNVETFTFPDGEFSHVIHGAVAAGRGPLEVFDSIVKGTRRTLEFAAMSKVKRLLFLSSGAVYGPQPSSLTHLAEDYVGGPDPLLANSGYGEGKRAAEHICSALASVHGIDAIVARCFAFSGPYLPLNANFAIGNFVADALAGRPIRVQGDGTPYRSYLYAADLSIWLWRLLLQGVQGRAYNVGSDNALTISSLAEAVAEVAGSNLPLQIMQQPKPGIPPLRYVPSIGRARTELGLDCWIELKEGIRRMIDWLQ